MPTPAVTKPNSQFSDVADAQSYLREGVQGYGEMLKPELMQQIGTALGGLNETGGLRSGGTKVALEDISTKYGNAIGSYAKQATEAGVGYGLEAHRQRFAEDEARRRRRSALLRAIGSTLGAAVGFFAGGAGKVASAVTGGNKGGPSDIITGGGME